jgi:hypothetical protein
MNSIVIKQDIKKQGIHANSIVIKQDINFLDKPLWFQDIRQGSKDFIWTDIEGYIYRSGYKLPDKIDILILFYLMLKAQENEYQTIVKCSRREILKACGLPVRDNKYYARVEDSLKRWQNIAIEFKGTFYDGKQYIAIGFGIIDEYEINNETKVVEVSFNEKWLLRIKESHFFKYINFEYYKALKRSLSQRLYEILCKSFKGRDRWTIHLAKLGAKLTLSGVKVRTKSGEREVIYASHVLVAIKPAINEINQLATIPDIIQKIKIAPEDLFTVAYEITGKKQGRKITFIKQTVLISKAEVACSETKAVAMKKEQEPAPLPEPALAPERVRIPEPVEAAIAPESIEIEAMEEEIVEAAVEENKGKAQEAQVKEGSQEVIPQLPDSQCVQTDFSSGQAQMEGRRAIEPPIQTKKPGQAKEAVSPEIKALYEAALYWLDTIPSFHPDRKKDISSRLPIEHVANRYLSIKGQYNKMERKGKAPGPGWVYQAFCKGYVFAEDIKQARDKEKQARKLAKELKIKKMKQFIEEQGGKSKLLYDGKPMVPTDAEDGLLLLTIDNNWVIVLWENVELERFSSK